MRIPSVFILSFFLLQFAFASVQKSSVLLHEHSDCCCSVESCICPGATNLNIPFLVLSEFNTFFFINTPETFFEISVDYVSLFFTEKNRSKQFLALEFHSFKGSLDSCIQKSSYLI